MSISDYLFYENADDVDNLAKERSKFIDTMYAKSRTAGTNGTSVTDGVKKKDVEANFTRMIEMFKAAICHAKVINSRLANNFVDADTVPYTLTADAVIGSMYYGVVASDLLQKIVRLYRAHANSYDLATTLPVPTRVSFKSGIPIMSIARCVFSRFVSEKEYARFVHGIVNGALSASKDDQANAGNFLRAVCDPAKGNDAINKEVTTTHDQVRALLNKASDYEPVEPELDNPYGIKLADFGLNLADYAARQSRVGNSLNAVLTSGQPDGIFSRLLKGAKYMSVNEFQDRNQTMTWPPSASQKATSSLALTGYPYVTPSSRASNPTEIAVGTFENAILFLSNNSDVLTVATSEQLARIPTRCGLMQVATFTTKAEAKQTCGKRYDWSTLQCHIETKTLATTLDLSPGVLSNKIALARAITLS